ncbi:MAG: hypothetical protein LBS75_02275 [Synergistaceae bacterium]|jgi:hypothetical protein|nr:hypothetical protein [Synergistaceae bacterium]
MRKYPGFAGKALAIFNVAAMIALLSGGRASAAPPIYRSNVLTAQHVTLPGTHVAFPAPAGARPASDFVGFDLRSRGIKFVIIEKQGVSYSEAASTLTPEGLEALGIKLADSAPTTINNVPAAFITGSNISGGDDGSVAAQLLVIGNDKLTAYIYGYYPSADSSAASTVRNALLGCIFDPSPVKADSGGYSLSSGGTPFKFSDEVGGIRYYTLDGEPVGKEVSEAFYMSAAADNDVAPEEKEGLADSMLAQFLSAYEYTVDSRRAVNFAGLSGIETIARFGGTPRKVRTASGGMVTRTADGKGYQVLLFDDFGRVYVLSGIAVKNADFHVSRFMRITSTFSIVK